MVAMQSFGSWVQRQREALGLTRDELALAAGCSRTTIREVEADRGLPPPQALAHLTSVLTEPNVRQAARRLGERLWNLPAPLTSFVGRERELAELAEMLRRPDVRLITLTGPGGSGKTRLALRAAAQADTFVDGCCFVDLAPLAAPEQVAPVLARTLSLQEPDGRPLIDGIIAFLRPKQLLLLLDSFERLIQAAPLVGDILAAAPHVTILATSRVALQLYGEHEFPIAPLGLPEPAAPPDRIRASDAVQLFLSRIDGAWPGSDSDAADTAAIARICGHLDGLPLAIELAAAQLRRFPPRALLERLETLGTLAVLAGGPRNLPARQQTIRATIAWSYELLSPDEQALFARLSVFAGSFDAGAATAVCGVAPGAAAGIPATLERLVSQSLVQAANSPAGSFAMLETIRAYALERLCERSEEHALRDRQLSYYATLAESAEAELRGAAGRSWLEHIDAAYPNIQAALDWGLASEGDPSVGLRLAGALWCYWRARGLFREAARWREAPALSDGAIPALLRARALIGLAWVAERQGTYGDMFSLARAALALARQSADQPTILRAMLIAALEDRDAQEAAVLRQACLELAAALDDPWLRCRALHWFGRPSAGAAAPEWQHYWQTREQLATASGDPWLISELLMERFGHAQATHDLAAMREAVEAHGLLAREMGSRQALALTFEGQARLAAAEGHAKQALAYQKERLAVERGLDNHNGIGWAGLEIACLQLQLGDFAGSMASLDDAMAHLQLISERIGQSRGLCLRSMAHLWRGELARAAAAASASAAIGRTLERQADYAAWTSLALWHLGLAALAEGALESADTHFAEAAALVQRLDSQAMHQLAAKLGRTLVAALRGEPDTAARHMAALVAQYRSTKSLGHLAMGLWFQAPVLLAAGNIGAAEACCAEGLALMRQADIWPWAVRLLEVHAACDAQRGRPDLAARWWGAAADLRERIGARQWPIDRPAYEARVAAARAALGADAFAAAFAAGRALGWIRLVASLAEAAAPAERVIAPALASLEQEIEAAAAIQAGLLPAALPEPRGWQFAARLLPAHETAGDFYDCITLADGRIGLLIADVAGKGLGPALYMATGRALIRTLVGEGHVDPADLLARVNAYLLKETRADLFITAFYGVLDPARGTLVYANAGHPPPLVMNADTPAVLHRLAPTGLVLGVELDVSWKQQSAQLRPGDIVLLYTDGVTEAEDSSGGFFETERLIAALGAALKGGAEPAVAGVLEAVRAFASAAPQNDDITLLAAAWEPALAQSATSW